MEKANGKKKNENSIYLIIHANSLNLCTSSIIIRN